MDNRKLLTLTLISSLVIQSASAFVVMVSDLGGSDIPDFLNANFTNITEVRQGNFADLSASASQDALNGTGTFAGGGAADLVIIGRDLSSSAYSGAGPSEYNALSIPVALFTSYIARPSRFGWHGNNAGENFSTIDDETTLTSAGTTFFGLPAGDVNWHESDGNDFNGSGESTDVGTGDILATIGGGGGTTAEILAAHWDVGDAPARQDIADPAGSSSFTFPGERLLFNLDNDGGDTFASLTSDGESALITGLSNIGGLTPVPEPSTAVFLLLPLSLVLLRRRR